MLIDYSRWDNLDLSDDEEEKIINYTNSYRDDGFGAQYQSIMSGIAYCEKMKYKFHFTRFKTIEHIKTSQEVDSLTNFIGIPTKKENIKCDISESFSKIVHGAIKPSYFYTPYVLTKIRRYYYSTSKPIIKNQSEISIHIRRGDVVSDSSNNNINIRYTSNVVYSKIINFLTKKYPDKKITIYSQGKLEDFKDLQSINRSKISLFLNGDIKETFHRLVSSNILVTSKSSFSYTAAILNTNKIYYLDFWHKPLDHWELLSKILTDINSKLIRNISRSI